MRDQIRKGGDFEQKAFNWFWNDGVTSKPTALKNLRDGTIPNTVEGSYWDSIKDINQSIIEQLNFYNGTGIDCLRGGSLREG